MNNSISPVSLQKWILAAMIAPAVTIAAGCTWSGVLLTGLIFGSVSAAVLAGCKKTVRCGGWLSWLQCIWLGLLCGSFAMMSADIWDEERVVTIVSLTLIALAAFSAKEDPVKTVAQSKTILAVLRVTVILILAAGIPDRKTTPLADGCQWSDGIALVFLLPCLAVFLPAEGKGAYKATLSALVFTVAAAWIISGGTKLQSDPFYSYSKSIALFNTARRFEAAISFVFTLGWYALLSLLLSTAGAITEYSGKSSRKCGVTVAALVAAGYSLCNLHMSMSIAAFFAMIFWGLIPLGIQFLGRKQKSHNGEISP